jgi:hypothetical protein
LDQGRTHAPPAKRGDDRRSYAGTYTVQGDKVIHHLDASWDQTLTGTDQVRFFKLDGNILTRRDPIGAL